MKMKSRRSAEANGGCRFPGVPSLSHVQVLPLITAGMCNLENIMALCCPMNQALRELRVGNAGVESRNRSIQQLDSNAPLPRHQLQDESVIQRDSKEATLGIEAAKNFQRGVERCGNERIPGNVC